MVCECVNAFPERYSAQRRISLAFSATSCVTNWASARKPQLVLGVLGLIAYAPLYGALEYEGYKMHHNPQQLTFYLRLADTVIGANVVRQAVRFLASVTRFNFKWSSQDRRAQSDLT